MTVMEITQEQKKVIDEIIGELKCPKDFQCQKLGSDNLPRLKRAGQLLECLEQDAADCQWSVPFGFGYFCRCPLNNYIYNELKH
jgi:hypothetical protein